LLIGSGGGVFAFGDATFAGSCYQVSGGCDAPVATAIEEHYRPRFAGDAVPQSAVGACVALADKMETLSPEVQRKILGENAARLYRL